MANVDQQQATVTIAVIPRESFGFSCASLDDLYANTEYPFQLVYVDANSPARVHKALVSKSKERGFEYIRRDHYLSPNVARNLALQRCSSKYVVFVDNDIFFTPGWLGRLVECAEQMGSAIVGPLTCIDEPLHECVHNGGGHTWFEDEAEGDLRRIHQQSYLAGTSVQELGADQRRFLCDYVEFHVVLVRRDLFDKIGPLDERLLSTREHIDMCLLAKEAGEQVVCERASVITYRGGVAPSWSDIAYYMLRWSDAWDLASLDHFRTKWRLVEDDYFHKRYRRLGARRAERVLEPAFRRLPFAGRALPDSLIRFEHWLNGRISDDFAERHAFASHSRGLRADRARLAPEST